MLSASTNYLSLFLFFRYFNSVEHECPLLILSVILATENPKIAIDKIEISKPLKGRKFTAITPKPRADKIPIPHAAQPGARTPRKTPRVAKIPASFLSMTFTDIFVL